MLRRLLCVLALAGVVATAKAPECSNAQKALHRFLELDAATGRQWTEQLKALITATDNPGWDKQIVITGWNVGECRPALKVGVDISVSYRVVGVLDSAPNTGYVRYTHERRIEGHVFRVLHVRGGWKVSGTGELPPHLYVMTAIRQCRSLDQSADEVNAKRAIDNVLDGLKAETKH